MKPSSTYLVKKSFAFALTNIWRNKMLSLATISVIAIVLFIFNIILGINVLTKNALESINEKVDITVYLKDSTTFLKAQNIMMQLKKLEGVKEVSYLSKADAIKELQTLHPDISIIFDKYNLTNPLPASINIKTAYPSFHQSVENLLNEDQYKAYLSTVSTQDSQNKGILDNVSKNLNKLSNATQQIIFWLIIGFLIGGSLIIINALQITIYSRKKEIKIMKIVGTPYFFIKLPFIIEAIIYGICGVGVSAILFLLISKNLNMTFSDFSKFFLYELVITIILSAINSFAAVHEHLNEIK
ncbi:MAG: permease-like cell division protein FtsX [Candidatus Gracilibacteria bacterium]|jgi:cell division transport system permease protein